MFPKRTKIDRRASPLASRAAAARRSRRVVRASRTRAPLASRALCDVGRVLATVLVSNFETVEKPVGRHPIIGVARVSVRAHRRIVKLINSKKEGRRPRDGARDTAPRDQLGTDLVAIGSTLMLRDTCWMNQLVKPLQGFTDSARR